MNTEQERAAFEAWAGVEYRHAKDYTKRDYCMGLAAWTAGRAALQSQASGQSASDEIEGLRAHVALLKSALAQSERENDELRRVQPAAATAAPSDDEIEALAIKHIAPHHGKLVQAPYQRTEQFKRIKALILEVTARYGQAPAAAGDAQPTGATLRCRRCGDTADVAFNYSGTDRPPMIELMGQVLVEMRHARKFIASREKMHPVGIAQFDQACAAIDAAMATSSSKVLEGGDA